MKLKTDEEILLIIQQNTNLSASNIAVIAGYKPTANINSRIAKIAKNNKLIIGDNRTGQQTCKYCQSKYVKRDAKYGAWLCCSEKCYNTNLVNENIQPNLTAGKMKRINKVKQQKCIVCKHNIVVEVHHINCDRHDNRETNMVCLCANHHKMIHLSKYHKEIQLAVDEYMINKYDKLYDYIDNDNFYLFDNQKNRKIKRPDKEQLENQLLTMSVSEISRHYNVNNATAYKWIKFYEIQRKII